MSTAPLGPLRLGWRDHKLAIWYLGLLYRRPHDLIQILKAGSRTQRLRNGLLLYLHAVPYMIVLSELGRMAVTRSLPNPSSAMDIAEGIAIGCGIGIGLGIASGIAFGIAFGIAVGIAVGSGLAFGSGIGVGLGIAIGVGLGIASGLAVGIAVGSELGIMSGIGSGLGVGLGMVSGFAVGFAVGLAGGFESGISSGMAFWAAFWFAIFRMYYQPLYFWVAWPIPLPRLYRFHPVAWDDLCAVPFHSFSKLLVAYASHGALEAHKEIDRLITGYPSQRAAALRAQVVLIARASAQVRDLAQLDTVLAKVPEGPERFLFEAQKIRDWAGEIASIQARLNTNDRAIFRQPYADLLVTAIENLQARIGGFDFDIAKEFRAAAESWKQIALRQQNDAMIVAAQEPVHQVFRAGDPIDRSKEAFVPRDAVVGALEQQIMLSTGCPGIILYGRRRVGKSTMLRNLDGFLPPSVTSVAVSMQNPEMATTLEYMVRHLVERIGSLVRLSHGAFDLRGLYRFLGEVNEKLAVENRRVLVAIDEYEVIDRKIKEKMLSADLLDTMRESIQSQRQITWLLAGSHRITELPNANWTSYFVSARTVEVGPFNSDETRLLLTEPLKYSGVFQGSSNRPRFAASFWGNGGIERIHAEAAGWPALVQLIAETAVDLANNEGARVISASTMERSMQQSVVKGDTVLSQLMRGESTLPGEWEYISAFRRREELPPPEDDAVYQSLRNRQVIREENGYWRVRVPLMARWLRERG